MPRRPRLAVAGIPWHIIQRGVNRSTCFFAEDDYQFYLHYLGEYSRDFGCDIHAFVLMTNHVHLLLTPREPDSAGRMMKHLGQRYVQYVNRVNVRTGTLWEGRFRSCLTQTEDYVLACYRYIELNPVRAGIVTHPRHYRWSSYATNGEGKASDLITPHEQYLRVGRTQTERLENYRALFKAHMDPETIEDIRRATNGNYALGSKKFQANWKLGVRSSNVAFANIRTGFTLRIFAVHIRRPPLFLNRGVTDTANTTKPSAVRLFRDANIRTQSRLTGKMVVPYCLENTRSAPLIVGPL